MKPIIYPYKMTSKSATELAQRLGCKRVYSDRKYVPAQDHLVINWGNSVTPNWDEHYVKYLNHPKSVAVAGNKLASFITFFERDVACPLFTISRAEAEVMLDLYKRVYCRTKLKSHSGDGIVIATSKEELVHAPLYTSGIQGYRDEYRVHVFNGRVIDAQIKLKKAGAENVNTEIRNHANGYVYCRGGVEITNEMETLAIKAVKALELDFGGVDIVKMRKKEKLYVLEVNTAPGITGTSVESYLNAIGGLL